MSNYIHFKGKGSQGWLAVAPNGDTTAFRTLSECRAWIDSVNRAQTALKDAMTGPTSGGIAHQLAPIVLDAIIAGTIPGVTWRAL